MIEWLPDLNTSRAIRAAALARRDAAMADLAELELAERRGAVVDADEARTDVIAAYSLNEPPPSLERAP